MVMAVMVAMAVPMLSGGRRRDRNARDSKHTEKCVAHNNSPVVDRVANR
jgi:hypothetical protein